MAIRHVRGSELLAIDQSHLHQSRDAFFWLLGPMVQDNEQIGSVAVVHVRGPMEHHDDGCGDSYDAILARAAEAFACEDARSVVLRIDSPGGVVSGLTQTVKALRAMAAASGKRLVAYVDEMAASAAYALCCACEEILVPPSAITGSIGVISTMVDQTQKDSDDGYRFVVIASGTRKADGHPHVAISDTARAAEERRVEKLAMQFFRVVRTARGLPLEKIRGFQAGLFLGAEAVSAGIADDVMGWDDVLLALSDMPGTGLVKKPLAKSGSRGAPLNNGTQGAVTMALKLDALIKRTEAALATEKDKTKRAAITASLDAFKKTKHSIEKHETEEGADVEEKDPDDEDDEDKDDDEDDDKDDKKAAAGPGPKKAASKKKADDDGDEAEAEDEGDEAEALAATVRRATGKRGAAAQGALEALIAKAKASDTLADRLSRLEAASVAAKRDAMVDAALASHLVTRKEAVRLKSKSTAHVEAFLEARPKSLVYTTEEDMPIPAAMPGGQASLPPELEKMLAQAVAASDGKITREQFLADFQKQQAAMANGKGGGLV
jgi:ClpP class serine protease